jgi:hypothetical protein
VGPDEAMSSVYELYRRAQTDRSGER